MNRLVGYSLRNGLRQQRVCINQTRYLVTTQVGLARRRKTPKKEKEPDDHNGVQPDSARHPRTRCYHYLLDQLDQHILTTTCASVALLTSC